jgi:hypothetical protein
VRPERGSLALGVSKARQLPEGVGPHVEVGGCPGGGMISN